MKALRMLAAVMVATVAASGCASTSPSGAPPSTLDKIKASKTMAIGYRTSSIPFSYTDKDGKPVGYSIDLCTRVFEDVRTRLQMPDLQAKWVPVTVETRFGAILDGTIDIECGSTTNTLSRQEQVDFSLTTFVDGASLLGPANLGKDADLRTVRIAVIPGTTTERVVKEAVAAAGNTQAASIVTVKDHAEGLAAIERQAADVYASDRVILMGLAMSAPDPSRFALLDRYLSYEPYGLAMRRGDPAFRLVVNRVLARLYRGGGISAIYNKWFAKWGLPSDLLIAMYAIEGVPE